MKNLARNIFIFPIKFYQRIISPWLPGSCRFTPTCSDYALEAIERHGALVGGALAAWRIIRCNPFTHGGLDMVPTKLRMHDVRTDTCHTAVEKNLKAAPERP